MNKRLLSSLLADKAVMDQIRGTPAALEAARSAPGGESIDFLMAGGAGIEEGPFTRAKAIILLQGRPALLIQDDRWENPSTQVIRDRLNAARVSLEAAIPKVGRVEILDYTTDYVGTGWMIDEDVLITNRHVAQLFGEARGNLFSFRANADGNLYEVRVDFRREHDRTAIRQAAIQEIIHIEDEGDLRPDLALVRLERAGGPLPAPVEIDDTLLAFDPGQPANLAVIGYPAYDPRNDAFAMGDIFKDIYEVKRLSPGRLMGVRPDGKLLEHDCTTLGGNSGSLVLNLATGKACGLHFSGSYRLRNYAVTSGWLKLRLAEIGRTVISMPAIPGTPADEAPPVPDGRDGYQPDFLGAGDLQVPLPELPRGAKPAPVTGRPDGELKYRHFSIVMRANRRLPYFTACNIDGGLLYNFPRGKDRWFREPRLVNPKHQTGEDLYRDNSLDRGHLVRRLDPAWGATRAEAKQAEQDTFYLTNCSPQHWRLNQQSWVSLEDYVLGNAATHRLKVCVFAGPVMDDNDRTYRTMKIPEEFWKVAVIVNTATGRLSATGYMLSQANYLGDLEFLFGEFRTYQVPIGLIESKTALNFNLTAFDPLGRTKARPERVLRGASDLNL